MRSPASISSAGWRRAANRRKADPATDSFLLSIDGGGFFAVTFANANNELLNYTGNVFAFEQKSGNADFYVSALAYNATPIPAALPLFATGLGTLGLLGWRRRRKAAA